MHLKQLSISGFRGFGSHLDLPLGHQTIIYGPNGSGKSSALQAIPWTIYGKLPFLSGTVFTREDALVNDFLSEGRAQTGLTFSDGSTMARTRDKQSSTSRGSSPVSTSLVAQDPQSAIENFVDLSLEEFFAAVFLHQETIRDFITTTPEKRSSTIDRMLGTYLLRTLIRVVDPKVPDKAIKEAQEKIRQVDLQLSQSGVITREMIQKRKEEHGDPAELPGVLGSIHQQLVPAAAKLGLAAPDATISSLESTLDAARHAQLDAVSALETQVGQLNTLRERYHQAAVTSWQSVHQRRQQYGDPADLESLLPEIQRDLAPAAAKLGQPTPGETILELEEALVAARRAQPRVVGRLEESIGRLRTLQERYEHAAITSWQSVRQRREQYGDPGSLSALLDEIHRDVLPVAEKLRLRPPQAVLLELETTLASARRVQPTLIGKLRETAGQLSTLRERYHRISEEVVEDVSVPSELTNRRSELQAQFDAVNLQLLELDRQLTRRKDTEQELADLQQQVQALPELRHDRQEMKEALDALEAAGKHGELYNQILSIGRDYLEQAEPERCPLCKQRIADLQAVVATLGREMPADVERMREDYKRQLDGLRQKQDQIAQLEQRQERITALKSDLAGSTDLESRIQDGQDESERLSYELATVQGEIAEIEGRIKLAAEHRRELSAVLEEIEHVLEQPPGENASDSLDEAIESAQERAVEVEGLDFEPISTKLERARQLGQIEKDETALQERLDAVLVEIERVLTEPLAGDVTLALDQEIQGIQKRAVAINSLDFEPVAGKLEQAKQLSQIAKDEAELRRRLDAVMEEVEAALGQRPAEDVAGALDQAVKAMRKRATEIQGLDLREAIEDMNKARQLVEIQKDEARLQELESGYRTARREKARLRDQIERLRDLRRALLDIAQTTKRHQQTIVTGILNELDIDRYYQQLDPHPAYRQLQIEPELTSKGTYNYWIKALTDDRSHGTYVQTRFSTAQANSAAIAIFLAVNEHLSRKVETLILDDPSQSMDPDHQMRLAQTLAHIPRQVIVATEDPQMFEFLADAFESPTIHRLDRWTVDGGRLAK